MVARFIARRVGKKLIKKTAKKSMSLAQKNALRKAVKASAMARKGKGKAVAKKVGITLKNSPTRLKVAAGVGVTGVAANKQAKRKSNASPAVAKYARTTATLGQSIKASTVTAGSLAKNSALTIAGRQSTARGFANVAKTAATEQAKITAVYTKGTKNVIRANKNKKKK